MTVDYKKVHKENYKTNNKSNTVEDSQKDFIAVLEKENPNEEDNRILDKIPILLFTIAVSGVFGFIYETLFYKIDLGYFVKRGTTFGPWIPIYAIGGLLITLVCGKLKNKPLYIFLVSVALCGLLEFLTGYLLFNLAHIRLWDYNTEIWNYGNIGGYICLRSVLFFGISGVFLMKVILPTINKIKNKLKDKKFYILSILLGSMLILDIIVSNITRLINII